MQKKETKVNSLCLENEASSLRPTSKFKPWLEKEVNKTQLEMMPMHILGL